MWRKQDRIDRAELDGLSDRSEPLSWQQRKRRIRQLETELAVSRKVNEVFLGAAFAPKGSTR